MTVRWKEIWVAVRNSLRALRKGEFLLSIGAHKYYLHIIYLFILAWISILVNLKVDKTLTRVEENKVDLRDLEIYHAEKEADLVKLHSASTTQKNLRRLGSDVTMPEKPATKINP
ncbi:MAG: hypothetical protein IJ701_04610 [Bacteroidales bacterium]|nr:hypothetical protein [Bacteroidales bacterium]MBR1678718.1 hypothetical protein [Bacteroidales bacterium]